jgi:hypothetical protein
MQFSPAPLLLPSFCTSNTPVLQLLLRGALATETVVMNAEGPGDARLTSRSDLR